MGGWTVQVGGREVTVTHPDKVVFPHLRLTKRDLIGYYHSVADAALRGVRDRPMVLKRFVQGIEEEAFFQKRAPSSRPDWIDVAELRYASGRSAQEVVVRDAATLTWVVNLGCVDLNPHAVRADDLDHPDELRIDLDPVPGVGWSQIVDVALLTRHVLDEHGLVSWPKTSGSRGFHLYCRIHPVRSFADVRVAAQAVAREVERRAPHLATAQWWKEDRRGVFVDFNQNAKDRTVASAYSVRPTPDARVSTPLSWTEVAGVDPAHFTVASVPSRVATTGDPWVSMDDTPGDLDSLLELAAALGPPEKPPPGTGRRRSSKPLVEVARTRTEPQAREAIERWRNAHPRAAAALQPADVLIDRMRGRSSLWYRVRINLEHVPTDDRPGPEPLLADYDPWTGLDRSEHG